MTWLNRSGSAGLILWSAIWASSTGLAGSSGVSASGVSASGQDHLTIERAEFTPPSAKPGDEVTLELEIQIRRDWHLYGASETVGTVPTLSFSMLEGLKPSGEPSWPKGLVHGEGAFKSYWVMGNATYSQTFTVSAEASGEIDVSGAFEYLACTERNCDPPAEVEFKATLAVVGGAVGDPGKDDGPEAVEATEFPIRDGRVSVIAARLVDESGKEVDGLVAGQEAILEVDIRPDPGWHVYGKMERIGLPPKLVTTSDVLEADDETNVPAGIPHDSFGTTSFWLMGKATLRQKIRAPKDAVVGSASLSTKMIFTACDERMCDPELTIPLVVLTSIKVGSVVSTPSSNALDPANSAANESHEGGSGVEDSVDNETESPEPGGVLSGIDKTPGDSDAAGEFGASGDVKSKSWLQLILAAIGAGLFALVMPCTYPMIPITISFFTKQAEKRGGTTTAMSLAYGTGIVLIFIVLGLAASTVIVPFATHPITNLVIGAAFVIFALSLFGMINLQPPKFLTRTAAKASTKGGYGGVFLMGATLVVTSFTCTAPFIGTLLSSIAESGYFRVGVAMGIFGLTMAIPFVALSLMPSQVQRLPKSGEWMNTLKVTFGFIELAAAVKFFSNAEIVWHWNMLPRELFLVIWSAIFFVAGFFLLGQIKLKGDPGEIGPGRMLSGLGSLILTAYFAYGSMGYSLDNDVMRAFEPPYTAERIGWGAKFDQVHTIIEDDFDLAVETAIAQGKEVLVNFTGHT